MSLCCKTSRAQKDARGEERGRGVYVRTDGKEVDMIDVAVVSNLRARRRGQLCIAEWSG